MFNLLKRIFTWWGSQTIGTQLYTWRKGRLVGQDASGNRYYQTKNGARRWVIFAGDAEASKVTAQWHGWLHHTYGDTPDDAPLAHKDWEQPHLVNLTGTNDAYAPAGSLRAPGGPVGRHDYEAWQPK